MSEFQRALIAAFEAGPPEVPDLRIDQLDGRYRAEPERACVLTFCAEPVRRCLTRVAEPAAAAAG